MKKAVIRTGGKQYIVSEGDTVRVELLKVSAKPASKTGSKTTAKSAPTEKPAGPRKLNFEALLMINGDQVEIGAPTLSKATVTAEVIEADIQAEKVTAIRYKPKKRVRKVRGHRQRQSIIKITKIG